MASSWIILIKDYDSYWGSWLPRWGVLHWEILCIHSFDISELSTLLTHWGRETHICVSKLTIIGSDNGLSPGRRQAIIWTNAGILLIGPLETNFGEILVGIQTLSFKKMHLKMSSAKWRLFRLGLNVLSRPLSKFMIALLVVLFVLFWYTVKSLI